MAKLFSKGTRVEWNWGDSTADGDVVESFTERVSKTTKGTEVTRNADDENPAYLIEQSDGSQVLKSHSELKRID